MSSNMFRNAAWYLYTYTGTLDYDRWLDVVKDTYSSLKKELGNQSSAADLITKMVAYYCLEVGRSYKGDVAATKFKKCYRWPTFKTEFSDSDKDIGKRWQSLRDVDQNVVKVRSVLAKNSIAPEDLVHYYRTREALRMLEGEVERRHGADVRREVGTIMRNLVSIYGPDPFIIMAERPMISPNFYGQSDLMNREEIPTMLTSYFIERAVINKFGEDLLMTMKEATIRDATEV